MKKVNQVLLIFIIVLTAVIVAAAGFRVYQDYDNERRLTIEAEERELAEMMARNEEAQNRVKEMEQEIQDLTADKEELIRFIEKIKNPPAADSEDAPDSDSSAVSDGMSVSGNGTVSGNATVSGNGTVSGNATISGNGTVSGNETVSGNGTVSGNETVSGNGTVSGNETVSGNGTVSGNATVSGNGTVSGNATVSGNGTISGNDLAEGYEPPEFTLEERRLYRTSLEETQEVNRIDRECIESNQIDFSDVKIACLGDSITAAANLESEENYQQYAYPARLKELLGAEEVYNLGIGGSSIGRYWADAFVDRYQEIPEDVDIIIVMGGTNDGFCVSEKEFGTVDECAYRTFCGDLDELMRGLSEDYPDADIFFATPLPNILHDYLMQERDYLLPQRRFADIILQLAQKYDFEVVDLYNSNILDSHDADVVEQYVLDGVHCNQDGYQIMAEHFASELIQYYEENKMAPKPED